MPDSYVPIGILVLAPGAFFVLAALTALQNWVKSALAAKGKDTSKIQSGCSEDCMNCSDSGCSKRFYDAQENPKAGNVKKESVPKANPKSGNAEDEKLEYVNLEEEDK